MRFNTIKYIEWFKTKSKVKIDLCSSSVDQLRRIDLDIAWEDLEISGENFYGYPPLLGAIGERYGVSEENVVSTIGTSHALFVVCAALVERGDVVLVEAPVYEPLLAVPKAFDAQVMRLPREFEQNYGISLEKFKSLLTPRTKLVLLTNLHNPSGALISRLFLEKMTHLAGEKNILLVIDEIYLEFMEGETTGFHFADNVIIISSLTKVFGLGDLRCGWVLAQSDIARRMRRIIDYINVEGTYIGERIAYQMFDRLDDINRKNREIINTNKSSVKELINQEENLSWVEPKDGVVCFPRIESGLTGDELAARLRADHDTAIVPGSFFEQPQHFRLGFGGDSSTLADGLENIRKALKESPLD
jgi:aspartate/methionine/tyrosine aminotransferase